MVRRIKGEKVNGEMVEGEKVKGKWLKKYELRDSTKIKLRE
jgi:hypothetical protein